jgi:hypothetical protein
MRHAQKVANLKIQRPSENVSGTVPRRADMNLQAINPVSADLIRRSRYSRSNPRNSRAFRGPRNEAPDLGNVVVNQEPVPKKFPWMRG